MNGIVGVRLNVAFKIIVANYCNSEYRLSKNQILAHLLTHAGSTIPTTISLPEILGVIEETTAAEHEK